MPRAGERTTPEELARRFAVAPPLALDEALIEASRCLFCFDAPCTRACPTGIDVPRFIRQILHRNELGAARTILGANIFGGSCARACPTEVLCEGACVDRTLSGAPIPIGRLQQRACDSAVEQGARFFEPGPPTGRKVGVVGSGPAGLTCAHELRRLGHEVIVFEARSIPGGLNTQGVAAYKIATEFALAEIGRICEIGIDLRLDHPVDPDDLPHLIKSHGLAACFVGVGLGRTRPLGIEGEDLAGVWESLDFIAPTRLQPFADCEVGRQVVVIGGGNTAIDAATAARRLGADRVTIVYRKGDASMPAFAFEYDLARRDGVQFEWFARPTRIVGEAGAVRGVELIRTRIDESGRLQSIPGSEFVMDADMVIKALGQGTLDGWEWIEKSTEFLDDNRMLTEGGRDGPIFVGGDCLRHGGEVVDAVEDGKRAARGIDAYLKRT